MPLLQLHASPTLVIYSASSSTALECALLPFGISAGFPSPALDFIELSIDLNRHLVKHPSATFFGRVQGDSMRNAGIDDGDLLVIDKSIEPGDGKIAVCYLDGEFTLKRIRKKGPAVWLVSENEKYPPIPIEAHNELQIWGIVTYVIKKPL